MHINIPDETKKRFHAACAIRGLKMSRVVVDLIEQWLKTNEVNSSGESKSESDYYSNPISDPNSLSFTKPGFLNNTLSLRTRCANATFLKSPTD